MLDVGTITLKKYISSSTFHNKLKLWLGNNNINKTMPEITNEEEGSFSPPSNLLKKYELGKLLGCGAFAKVYHARDLRTGQSVAIKCVSKQRIYKGNLTVHIKQEISIMSRLRHPRIVRLHEVLATKTKIYFVMEFVKGGELFAKLAKGRFSEDLSRKFFQQLISAVNYCHSRGIFHRDLKPENLLLDENWELKVTDFGLSAVTDPTQPDGMLHTLCGTPAYVAPEILAKKGYDGAKVDVWSCGVILYVFIAGYLPFNDTNLMVMYRKIYKGEFRCPKWISPDMKRFLTRILDPNPVTRITVHQILNDPWFSKGGYEEETRVQIPREFDQFKESCQEARFLNAFDIISFSSGADLSGLLSNGGNRVYNEMLVSAELPGKIVERIGELAGKEDAKVVKKGGGVMLLGQNGNFVVMVEINRLTEELVVVAVKGSVCGMDFWKEKLKPRLIDLVYTGGELVAG